MTRDGFRYAQFCPIARAAEVVGERWTLLIVRDLTLGPLRFSDLQRRLPGVSSSVLAERLGALERRGLVRRREVGFGATAYELTEAGRRLEPVLMELARFGAGLLLPAHPGDHVEADWVGLGMRVFARTPSPPLRYRVEVSDGTRSVALSVTGGPEGTRVGPPGAGPEPDATLRLTPFQALGVLSGLLDPVEAARRGELELAGDPGAARRLPELFELPPLSLAARPPGPAAANAKGDP
jgi:DNA-binding HxlR family transcriptional regulator